MCVCLEQKIWLPWKRDLTLLYSIRIDKVKTIARSRDVAVELKNILRNRYSTEK